MTDYTNNFAWSITRQKALDACKRQYYYQYYGKWYGWNFDAPPEAKLAYRLSKLTTLPMLAGSVVHDQIEYVLSRWRKDELVSLDEVIDRAIARLQSAWAESRHQEWLDEPARKTNLFEHYYGRDVTSEYRLAIGQTVRTALASFFESAAYVQALETPTEHWKAIEDYQSFDLHGVSVKLRMDFALQREGRLHIYDWKTGKSTRADPDQLFTYALYAQATWGVPLEDIVLNLVFLNHGEEQPFQLPVAHGQAFVNQVLANAQAMKSHLVDPDHNIAHIDNFPMTDNLNTCRRCNFQQLCHGGAVDSVSNHSIDPDDFQDD